MGVDAPPGVVTASPVTFTARDGAPLAGTLRQPDGPPRAALVVNGGTGIPHRFYGRFAAHAAGRGVAVLTWDYRGIGASAPPSLKGYRARYRDWGQRDVPAAIGWLRERFPDVPLVAVGHSTGGQQLGLAPNVDEVAAAVFVAVSTGYWRGMPRLYGLMTRALFATYRPVTSGLFGYVPARAIGWGENLPVGVAREWAAWYREPDYMASAFDGTGRRPTPDGEPFGPTHFDRAAFPIRAYCFPDDPISTAANVPPMLGLYDRAEIETVWTAPTDLGRARDRPLGLFPLRRRPPAVGRRARLAAGVRQRDGREVTEPEPRWRVGTPPSPRLSWTPPCSSCSAPPATWPPSSCSRPSTTSPRETTSPVPRPCWASVAPTGTTRSSRTPRSTR